MTTGPTFRCVCACAVAGLGIGMARSQPGQSATPNAPRKPNILLIVTDDLGYGDLGFQGGKEIPTPNLDTLAAGGVRFTNAYVTGPICGPTRAGLLSGRYQQRHSYDGNPSPNNGLSLNETTLADALKAGGYKTAALGKWHLGTGPAYRPLRRGFDEFFGFYGAMHSYVPGAVEPSARMVFETTRKERDALAKNPPKEPPAAKGPDGFGPDVPGAAPGKLVRSSPDQPDVEVAEAEYLTEALAREAVAFVDRNRRSPFFLYLAFNASHSPLQPTKKYLDRFPTLAGKRKAYAATTSALDDAVGAVLTQVRALGLEEDTLVYFINDNGGPVDDIAANNAPLGGAKFSLWEGGIRVPAVVSWKGKVAAGQVFDTPVSSLDAFPTLLDAAGHAAPASKQLDGLNLLPALRGGPVDAVKARTLYWRYDEFWAIRSGDWKLVLPERGERVQLFDLSNDIAEGHDLAAGHPDVVKRLTAEWKAWDGKNLPVEGATRPGGNTSFAEETRAWRADREARLRADNGWLTLAGRYPLQEGANTFGTGKDNDVAFPAALAGVGPARLGTLQVDPVAKRVTLKLADGVSMASGGNPFTGVRVLGTSPERRDWVGLGRFAMHIIERNGKYVLRLADNESPTRKNFTGCVWYAADEAYKVEAKFVPYPGGRTLSIVNVIDEVSDEPCPGYAEFELKGRVYKLDAIREGEGLFFVFRDGTAGDSTYQPARFIDIAKRPQAAETFILDFNKAYNPPCAFSDYTTCPLPPKQNILSVRIEAGEKYLKPR